MDLSKLGITPWYLKTKTINSPRAGKEIRASENYFVASEFKGITGIVTKETGMLIAVAPEMIQAMIEFASWYKEPWKYNGRPVYKFGETFIEIIEKALGKDWKEITKELM